MLRLLSETWSQNPVSLVSIGTLSVATATFVMTFARHVHDIFFNWYTPRRKTTPLSLPNLYTKEVLK